VTRPARRPVRPSARSRRGVRGGLDVAVSREPGVAGPSGVAIARVARLALRAEGVRRAVISIALVGNATIRRLNGRYLARPRLTDVIAFSLPGDAGVVAGDVYVAPRVAEAAAAQLGIAVREEVLRLVVHGVLHVLGYDHPAGPGRMRSAMWRRQEALLLRALRAGAR